MGKGGSFITVVEGNTRVLTNRISLGETDGQRERGGGGGREKGRGGEKQKERERESKS